MKTYEVKGPCPELSLVLAKLVAELEEGAEARIVSKWRYVVKDIENAGRQAGLEVVSVRDAGDTVEVVVRKTARRLHL